MLLASPDVRDFVADHDTPVSALADDPRLESEIADDRRAALAALAAAAATFDPLGLYAMEVERDDAAQYLADNLPAGCSIRLAHHHITQRHAGQWETIAGWVASATNAASTFTLSENGERPLVAAELLVNAWRRSAPAATAKLPTSSAA